MSNKQKRSKRRSLLSVKGMWETVMKILIYKSIGT